VLRGIDLLDLRGLILFIVFFPFWPRLLRTALASNTSFARASGAKRPQALKIKHFRSRAHPIGSFSVVTELPMLVSCLPWSG
jgi:hypothetical protein